MSAAHPSRPTTARVVCTTLWALLAMSPGQADEAPPSAAQAQATSEGGSPWLAEVRAQRRAWEAQRQTAEEAIDARRRWQDPWAAAQHKAREQAFQQRREERLEQIDRDRERFRRQGPWSATPAPPWPGDTPGDPEHAAPPPPDHRPPGWDNGWYYRGY